MKNTSRILQSVIFFPLAVLLVIIIHEIGHVVVARLFGDSQANYFLYKRYPSGGFCIGCFSFGLLPETGTLFVKIGGVIFTQIFFFVLLAARKAKTLNFIPRLPITILAVLFFLDLPFQILQGFRSAPDAPKSGIDFADFSQLLSLQTNVSAFWIQIVLLAVFLFYLLLLLWLYRTRPEEPTSRTL